jgi:iron(III) transport system ATP-binding protein
MTLQLHDISHRYGEKSVLTHIDLKVADGEIVCILGPSGSGKSTLLRIIAGLEPIQNGVITLNDELLADASTNPPPENRPIGLVFQDHVLFPHQTVAENIAFGLSDMTREEKAEIVTQQLSQVDLSGLTNRYPDTLSGGQQQRVALVRALATKPSVMLLDEPFASADTPLRRKLREQARATLKRAGTPTLMVTHDPEEAMDMADRILVIVDGSEVQLGTPESLWQTPQSPFVAQTLAGMQSIEGSVSGGHVKTAFGVIPLEVKDSKAARPISSILRLNGGIKDGQNVIVCLRGGSLALKASSGPAAISDKRFMGSSYLTLVTAANQQLRVESSQPSQLPIGTLVEISFDSAAGFIYSK